MLYNSYRNKEGKEKEMKELVKFIFVVIIMLAGLFGAFYVLDFIVNIMASHTWLTGIIAVIIVLRFVAKN